MPSSSLVLSLTAAVLVAPSVAFSAGPRLTLRMAAAADERSAVATSVALSADGSLLAAAGDDHRVRLWETVDGTPVQTLAGHGDWVRAVRFAPDGERLATVADDRLLRLWSLGSLSAPAPAPRTLAADGGPLRAVAFRPDGRRLAAVGYQNHLRVYDIETGDALSEKDCGCRDMNAVAFSADGRWLAAGGRNGRVRLWAADGDGPAIDLPSDGRRVRAIAFGPRGDLLAAAGDGPAIRIWRIEPTDDPVSPSLPAVTMDTSTEEILTRPGKTHAIVFLNDHVVAAGGTSDTIRLFDTETGSRLEALTGHTGTVAALAASADGETLVSGSFDTTVRVWSIDEGLLGGSRVASRSDANNQAR